MTTKVEALKHDIARAVQTNTELLGEVERLRGEVAGKQAHIDRLMLEFCPDEMSAEQLAEWGKHQVAAPEARVPK